jgi:endonuclease YncB( thermonuclease family)
MQYFRYFTVIILIGLLLATLSCCKKETKEPTLADNYPNRVLMDKSLIRGDDGDSFHYDTLTIRVLGMDTPEITHEEHGFFEDQPYGREAFALTKEIFQKAERIEYVPHQNDKYGRLLAHVFVDGELLSEKLIRAGLAYETISHYGDNGFKDIAAHILEVAKNAPTPQFEPPWKWRRENRREPVTTENH